MTRTRCFLPVVMLLASSAFALESVRPHAGMLRYPDVSQSQVVFVYAGDLWLAPIEGGHAVPLASPPGQEAFPKFSPDGKQIAFVGSYDGNRDLYTVPASGGLPTRVTHHPASETLCDWTASGKLLFYSSGAAGLTRQTQLFTVSASGGLPDQLPVPYGANGAISADGRRLAYTPHTIDTRTWKRYRGGMATDIWLFDLQDRSAKKITDWEGTDSLPMWHNGTVYYMADQGSEHRLNIWAYDATTGAREQVTHCSEYDVKWPSIGPGPEGKGAIVYQLGPELHVLDLAARRAKAIEVIIPGDRPTIRPKSVSLSQQIADFSISPTGQRAVIETRGEIWTLPAKKGPPRNLTRSDEAAERDPAWSPDGRWIAYLSDATGEYELYLTQSDGQGETKQLTKDGKVFRYTPIWSPDSKQIAFSDKTGAAWLIPVEGGEPKLIDTDPRASRMPLSWSHDSSWIAYTKGQNNRIMTAVWLYHVPTGDKHQVTSGMFADSWPAFDRKGDYLYFASHRRFTSPIYEDLGTTFVYVNSDVLLAVPLRKDQPGPWPAKSDEEKFDVKKEEPKKDEEKKNGEKKDEQKKDEDKPEKKSLKIDLDGFERRAVQLPVKAGAFSNLAVAHDGKLIYARGTPRGSDGTSGIKIFDITDDEKQEKSVFDGVGGYSMSADGKKLLLRGPQGLAIVDAAASQKADKAVPTAGLETEVDPRAEWKQVFQEAWRIERDFFYDPTMHGVDWPKIREQYARMLDDCVSRDDVTYVIGEMLSELNVGHAYVQGVAEGGAGGASVGLLGVDFELHDGAYRIAKIHEGGAWDADARGPLSKPGVNVKVGDYVLAVNRLPVSTSKDPWAAFSGLGGRVATITVSERPKLDDKAREITLELLSSERDVRYRSWIERNRAYVAEKTGGKVGYIYVPNTGVDGQDDLVRQYFGQIDRAALIIDERWNGGGQIPTRFVELLNRPVTNYWARRDGKDWTWPPDAHQGPKCMLINGLAGSGGDAFPAYFRQAGLGKLIGMRTWGGLVGISGNPRLIDGGSVTAPTFAYYEKDGTWGIEGHGVDPDIEVIDDPSKMTTGGDPQLDAAIEHTLAELQRNPYTPPKRPAYPDRRGFGIKPEDK